MRKITFPYVIAAFMMHNTWISKYIPDSLYLKLVFKGYVNETLNLDNPTTYNEKLQWLKLNDRNPQYTKMVDKHAVKDYVAGIIGKDYIIRTLGVWEHFDEIDFEKLPDRFVLKCTHDSGGLVICKDKSTFDKQAARKKIEKSLSKNFFFQGREWPYKNVPPRIIAEEFMEDKGTNELRDYKFFCFNGKAKALFIATDRQTENEDTKFDFFDMDYNLLPFTNGHNHARIIPAKPAHFDEMKMLAEKLSKGIPQVRIDFYEVDGKVYFGEMTFFHWSGLVPFEPSEWDTKFGEWIELPAQKR